MTDWQDISTAPKDGTSVLIYTLLPLWKTNLPGSAITASWREGCWVIGALSDGTIVSVPEDKVTNWQLLPEAPK